MSRLRVFAPLAKKPLTAKDAKFAKIREGLSHPPQTPDYALAARMELNVQA